MKILESNNRGLKVHNCPDLTLQEAIDHAIFEYGHCEPFERLWIIDELQRIGLAVAYYIEESKRWIAVYGDKLNDDAARSAYETYRIAIRRR